MTATVWLRSSRLRASVLPTGPQPMITTCTLGTLHGRPGARGPTPALRRSFHGCRPYRCFIVGLTDISKRVLVGRKLRSTQLGETLLPKRIALPVFASDPLSSVAYAPGRSCSCCPSRACRPTTSAPGSRLAVVVLMFTVVASYRQNVHAYPSGGGDYEVATTNLGPQGRA